MKRTVWNPADVMHPLPGAWGSPTASLDWCERNYEWSHYVAEMFNTITNLGYLAFSLFGVYKTRQHKLPWRITLCFLANAAIGIGSALFHSTLLYSLQLLDEIPMMWSVSILAYIAWDLTLINDPRRPWYLRWFGRSKVLPLALVLANAAFIQGYLHVPDPVLHQVAFGVLLASTVLRAIYISRSHPDVPSSAITVQIRGVVSFLLGWTLWNIDNVFCSLLTSFKPRAPGVFELHAYWHLLTGYGGYLILVGLAYATLCIRDSPHHYELVWAKRVPGVCWVERTRLGWEAQMLGRRSDEQWKKKQ